MTKDELLDHLTVEMHRPVPEYVPGVRYSNQLLVVPSTDEEIAARKQ